MIEIPFSKKYTCTQYRNVLLFFRIATSERKKFRFFSESSHPTCGIAVFRNTPVSSSEQNQIPGIAAGQQVTIRQHMQQINLALDPGNRLHTVCICLQDPAVI